MQKVEGSIPDFSSLYTQMSLGNKQKPNDFVCVLQEQYINNRFNEFILEETKRTNAIHV